MPPHEHHSPSAKPPPPPPGVEVDPMLHGYPQLPAINLQSRSPYGWWDQQERKNFDEVVSIICHHTDEADRQVHEEEDALSMWSPDQHRVEASRAALGIVTMLALVAGFSYYVTIHRPQRKAVARNYPYNGLEKELGGYSQAREEPIDDE
ncbi:hypothetical protein A1Q2_05392 [Trichosporon asahii var. asahii CBS 8904]|uniref:Uncharacterized protein n=1 Tax=Trichosporon asahii var. asahii (strain CBS 8904) TaxID=1220162 RepID=K1WFI5_TRIAC|nr:hypothetical protein A1Q2_05392 [Trichosporon asahii var. asahii CBS 8904]